MAPNTSAWSSASPPCTTSYPAGKAIPLTAWFTACVTVPRSAPARLLSTVTTRSRSTWLISAGPSPSSTVATWLRGMSVGPAEAPVAPPGLPPPPPALSPAPPPAPAPASISCAKGPLSRLSDCLTFVENGSSVSKPEGSCCSSLKGVVKDSPMCLCKALQAGGADFGIALNITKAFALPPACGISTPDFNFNTCALASPSPSPTLQLLPPPPENLMNPSTSPPASSVLPSLPPSTAKTPNDTTAPDIPPPASAAFALLIPCRLSVLSTAAAIIAAISCI